MSARERPAGIFVQGKGRQNLGAILARLRMDVMSRIAAEQRIARIDFKGNRKIEAAPSIRS